MIYKIYFLGKSSGFSKTMDQDENHPAHGTIAARKSLRHPDISIGRILFESGIVIDLALWYGI